MREILFKAKRIDNGEWVEGYLFFIVDTPYIICDGETMCMDGENTDLHATEWYEVDESTICQYTGLTDKNGNKIWENEIIQIATEDEYFHLEWQDDTARFVMNGDGFTIDFDNYWSYEVEVIGNIFDNPELIRE